LQPASWSEEQLQLLDIWRPPIRIDTFRKKSAIYEIKSVRAKSGARIVVSESSVQIPSVFIKLLDSLAIAIFVIAVIFVPLSKEDVHAGDLQTPLAIVHFIVRELMRNLQGSPRKINDCDWHRNLRILLINHLSKLLYLNRNPALEVRQE